MKKFFVYCGLVAAIVAGGSHRVAATYHVMVIQEVFPGFAQAPAAQYVVLRTQSDLQTLVHGQVLPTFDASGSSAGAFASFCPLARPQCDLPQVSPACAGGGCPSFLQGNDSRILVATPWAAGLLCVTPDLVATGTLPYPDGRVCFGNVGPFAGGCLATGGVDCVAYGQFTGDNGVFEDPAPALSLGMALSAAPERPSQCHAPGLAAMGLCVAGSQANAPCDAAEDCPGGSCAECPEPNCQSLVNNAEGFDYGAPAPRNFHGDVGALDGVAGDADGSGVTNAEDVDAEVASLFAGGRRCDLEAERRGADANLDTRVGAADVVAVVQAVALG